MNYKIKTEGGFTGIPQIFEGEMVLSSEETAKLLSLMKQSFKANENLRDGMTYVVEIRYAGEVCTAVFNDNNIPALIRKMMF